MTDKANEAFKQTAHTGRKTTILYLVCVLVGLFASGVEKAVDTIEPHSNAQNTE